MAFLDHLPALANSVITKSHSTPPDASIHDNSDEKSSVLDDVKEVNAHAIEETSTLENEGGAAVEIIPPLGRELGWFSAFFINVSTNVIGVESNS